MLNVFASCTVSHRNASTFDHLTIQPSNHPPMRTVLFLVQKEFLQIIRNRMMLPMMLIMPVVQMVLLSFAANFEVRNLALGVVDHDLSPASRRLVAKFDASGYFEVKRVTFSADVAAADIAADRTDLTLEIPPQFERSLIRCIKVTMLRGLRCVSVMP